MANRQYTFSLPPEVGNIIDTAPKMEKSKLVAEALLQFKKDNARQKTLDILASITPTDWDTDKSAVELVREARQKGMKPFLNDNLDK
jgi:hypothetical protein